MIELLHWLLTLTAKGITPAVVASKDRQRNPIDRWHARCGRPTVEGPKTCRVDLPPNVLADHCWAPTVYNVQTCSKLQTDKRVPEITGAEGKVEANADGSYDAYFGPERPAGKKNHWMQSVPGKGWHMLCRLHGPEQAWFDQSWRPIEIVCVEQRGSKDSQVPTGGTCQHRKRTSTTGGTS